MKKLVVACGVLAIATFGLVSYGSSLGANPVVEGNDAAAQVESPGAEPMPEREAPSPQRIPIAADGSAIAMTGALRIRARYADTGAPAPGVHLEIVPNANLASLWTRQVTTGADGTCEAVDLPVGATKVRAVRGGAAGVSRVIAGRTTELVVDVPAGVHVQRQLSRHGSANDSRRQRMPQRFASMR